MPRRKGRLSPEGACLLIFLERGLESAPWAGSRPTPGPPSTPGPVGLFCGWSTAGNRVGTRCQQSGEHSEVHVTQHLNLGPLRAPCGNCIERAGWVWEIADGRDCRWLGAGPRNGDSQPPLSHYSRPGTPQSDFHLSPCCIILHRKISKLRLREVVTCSRSHSKEEVELGWGLAPGSPC